MTQIQKSGKKPKSKYQRKLARRHALARKLDVPLTTTFPELWIIEKQHTQGDREVN